MSRPPMGAGGGGFGGRFGMGMTLPAERPREVRATMGRLLGRLRPELHRIVGAAILASAGVVCTVTGPRILGYATNLIFDGIVGRSLPAGVSKQQVIAMLRARGSGQLADMLSGMNVTPGRGIDFTQLGHVLALAALVYVVAALFSWGQAYIMVGVAQRTVYGMRRDVEAKLARLPLEYFDSHAHGDLMSRVTNDIDNLGTTLQQAMGQVLTSLLTIVGVVGMMFWISPPLAVASLVMVPLSVLVTFLVARRSQRQFAAQWEWTGRLNGHVEAMHTGHALVRVFGRRGRALAEFEMQNRRLHEATFQAQFLSGLIQPALQFLANLNYVVVAVFGGYRVVSGAMTLGDVQAFIQYSRQFTMPITQLASQMNLLQSGLASAGRVFELLAAAEETPDAVRTISPDGQVGGRVSLEHVSFRYRPDKPLLTDLSLDVLPGQTVAIVGPTGAGKTTLVNLLMRFYEVDSGQICLDGTDAATLPREEVRRKFGMVLQDTWLFKGTLHDNIAYSREHATEEEVVTAAVAAHADGFVRTLPDGYRTVLEEDASNISAGQRQLLAIARAFLADPPILILDEATSNVDTRTEILIQGAMSRLRYGRTSFIIAHRLSTIRNADTIVVMDAGRIVEQGTHADLLARGGFYHSLYQSQYASAK